MTPMEMLPIKEGSLSSTAYTFFFWYSRFEFALKQNGYLKSKRTGEDADPSWDKFERQHHATYVPSGEGRALLARPPKRQVVGSNGELEWKDLGLDHCRSELEKLVLCIKRIRNNLFHGGKHGGDEWDEPCRTEQLLMLGIQLLGQFAVHAQIDDDFRRMY